MSLWLGIVQNELERCPEWGLVVVASVPDGGVQNLGVEVAGGVLSRLVSPKLAYEAVSAKPPYFDKGVSKMSVIDVQNVLEAGKAES